MGSNRPERVAELLHREVTLILERDLADPRLAGVTVTDCEVSPDLKYATVFVSTLAGGREREQALQALARASTAVRRLAAPRLGLREVPEIRFRFDDSIERGARLEEILRRIREGEPLDEDEES
jgi:ribosome-binding factor A